MPYNTRRKSLSLPSLGIHIPSSNPRSTNKASPRLFDGSDMSPSSSTLPKSVATGVLSRQYQNKKLKRSLGEPVTSSAGVSASPCTTSKQAVSVPSKHGLTPPPSPNCRYSVERDETDAMQEMKPIDLSGIRDEIVEAVIVQLRASQNRPHLVKELATILLGQVKIVQQSANPCAIVSSRLSGYLKRSCWSATSPCPLAKELETVHPRRTYFYLTVCPHKPLPDTSVIRPVATPPLSSSASTSEDERRRELSLSPEVDLSAEFDDAPDEVHMPGTPIGSISVSQQRPLNAMSRSQGGDKPPLEKDEKEFTQTADGLQKRKLSGGLLLPTNQTMELDDGMQNELLFGETKGLSVTASNLLPHYGFMASPAILPSLLISSRKESESECWAMFEAMLDWDRSPETVELDELDCMLDEC